MPEPQPNSSPSNTIDLGLSTSSNSSSDPRAPVGASFAKFKIIVMSGKGGVGKSTVASNLAVSLALKGFKTGILDLDLTGPSIPKILGIDKIEPVSDPITKNLNPVPVIPNLVAMSLHYFIASDKAVIWRGSMRFKAIQNFLKGVNWGQLDFLIMDLPPGTGDEPITIAQQIPDPTGAVIVSTPQAVATQDVKKSILFANKMNIPILGVIENMSGFSCPHCNEFIPIFGQFGAKELSDSMQVPFLGFLPLSQDIAVSGDSGKSFVNSSSTGSKEFDEIVRNLLAKIQIS